MNLKRQFENYWDQFLANHWQFIQLQLFDYDYDLLIRCEEALITSTLDFHEKQYYMHHLFKHFAYHFNKKAKIEKSITYLVRAIEIGEELQERGMINGPLIISL